MKGSEVSFDPLLLEDSMLKAGFSRVDITPPLGTYLAGYYVERYATGVLEPIELNAVAVSDDKTTAVIIISDLQGLRRAWADPIRKKIAQETGLDVDCVSVTALHQHTSYALRPGDKNNVIKDTAFLDVLYRKFVDAAKMAISDLSDATASIGTRETAEPIAFIRRYIMKDSSVKTNPGKDVESIVAPAEEPDNTVRLVRFKREGKKDIALVNFATHPDVVGGTELSWDWPGYVRLFVERDLPDTHCLLMNGFEGDSNHCDFINGVRSGHDHCVHMGRIIADAVKDMWDNTRDCETSSVTSKVDIVYNRTRSDKVEYYKECRELYDSKDMTKTTSTGIGYTEAGRIVTAVESAPLFQKIPTTLITLGEVAIVGIAGEAFTNYARIIRERYPEKFILTSCSMNGHEGYLPTATAFEQGGYEVVTSPFTPTIEEDCMRCIADLMECTK